MHVNRVNSKSNASPSHIRNLIIVNYSMSRNSPFLSHQISTVDALSKSFQNTVVLTRDTDNSGSSTKYRLITSEWHSRQPLRNSVRLIQKFLMAPKLPGRTVVFFHMTDSSAAILSPFCKILGMRSVLWYAHKHRSIFLRFASIFLDSIVTSTDGSFPRQRKLALPIGQAIDTFLFHSDTLVSSKEILFKLYHVGRIDLSKNIKLLINLLVSLKQFDERFTLTLIGKPTGANQQKEFDALRDEYCSLFENGSVEVMPPIKQEKLVHVVHNFGIFVHAYFGSLDKSLLEASALMKPVVTMNAEYLNEFGSWSQNTVPNSAVGFLVCEVQSIMAASLKSLNNELLRRQQIVIEQHSLELWAKKVHPILIEERSK